jgi:carboxyl-terminal processing protease
MNKKNIVVILIFFTVLSLFVMGDAKKARSADDLESKLNIYLQVLDAVKNDYVNKNLDNTKLMYGSIRGLLDSLDDPYTRFLEPTSYKEMKIRLSGSYSGIGIYIGIKDKQLIVISPIKNTPAWKAGLKPKDKILAIEGKPTKDMALDEAVSLIRGPSGSLVTMSILRGSAKDPKDYKIPREKIVIKSVETDTLEGNIGYIKLNTFENQNAAEDMEKALNNMKKKQVKGIVLDVRNNGGGLLQNAIEIGSMFIKDGTIVYTVDREGKKETISSMGNLIWDRPIVMLINESSASASEILAGALHDNHKAVLVGTRSFGKASVQNVKQLEDGSAILLTIAKYLTPNGTDIMKKGIEPDYVVEMPTSEAEAALETTDKVSDIDKDLQLKKAVDVLNGLVIRLDTKTKRGARLREVIKGSGKARKVSAISL